MPVDAKRIKTEGKVSESNDFRRLEATLSSSWWTWKKTQEIFVPKGIEIWRLTKWWGRGSHPIHLKNREGISWEHVFPESLVRNQVPSWISYESSSRRKEEKDPSIFEDLNIKTRWRVHEKRASLEGIHLGIYYYWYLCCRELKDCKTRYGNWINKNRSREKMWGNLKIGTGFDFSALVSLFCRSLWVNTRLSLVWEKVKDLNLQNFKARKDTYQTSEKTWQETQEQSILSRKSRPGNGKRRKKHHQR